jgi:hypothetical protein
MVDRGDQQVESLEASADRSESGQEGFVGGAGRDWTPPPPVLEQLDHAAERLADLERRGLRLSVAVTPGGRACSRLRRRGRSREIGLRRLLAFLSGEGGSRGERA